MPEPLHNYYRTTMNQTFIMIQNATAAMLRTISRHQRSTAIVVALLLASGAYAQREYAPQYYVDTAKVSIRKEKWEVARTFVERGLTLYPDEADLNWLMGRYYYHKKDYKQARYYLVHCLQQDYSHVDAKQLMVKVEDETKNYSSAIAYCNELLEVAPYDKGLWRRKIDLYRKQDNHVLAGKLLERLAEIYPNDEEIQRDLKYRNELGYNRNMKGGQLRVATKQLEELIEDNPDEIEYYRDMVNIYKRRGMYDQAISTATMGIANIGPDQELITQKVKLLCGQNRQQEALNFIAEMKALGGNASYLTKLKNDATIVAADAARMNDPYEMTAKAYGITKSRESLNYLISTATSRGYYDDAVYYLNEAIKRDGETETLLYKRYDLERRSGHTKLADNYLDHLFEKYPNNLEVLDDYAQKLHRTATDEFIQRDWKASAVHLNQLIDLNIDDPDLKASAWAKLITCYCSLHQYEKAKEVYHAAIENDKFGTYEDTYTSLYEEGFITHIKALADDESWRAVFMESTSLLEVVPSSDAALRYAINSSDALHLHDEFDTYATMGYEYYPSEPYYIAHKAMSLQRNKQYDDALQIVRPAIASLDYNPQLVNVHSEISELYAYQLISAHESDSAQNVLDIALKYAPDSKPLKYAKGVGYERAKDLLSAYKYQSKYADISLTELPDFNARMKGLRYRGSHDKIDIEYQQTRANSQIESDHGVTIVSSLASLAYTHQTLRNSYTLFLNYKGVDGYLENEAIVEYGGTGMQGILQWEHNFSERVTGMANFGYANKFFSSITANLSASYNFNHDWTASLKVGYRRTGDAYRYADFGQVFSAKPGKYDLFIIQPSLMKIWAGKYMLQAQSDLSHMDNEWTYNVGGKAKIFLTSDAVTSVCLFGSIGTFPELNLFDQNMLHNLMRTNTTVGVDGQWLVAHNLCIGLVGTWFTYYNPLPYHGIIESTYRNLFNLDVQLHIAL